MNLAGGRAAPGIFETGAIIPSNLVVKKATRKIFQSSKIPKPEF
jgi:hypothetical protein